MADLRAHPERFGRSWLCSGVTAVFDVGGYPWTLALPAWAEPRTDVPRVAAAGPLLSTLDHWLNLPGERQFVYLTDAEAARDRRPLSEGPGLGRGQGLVHPRARSGRLAERAAAGPGGRRGGEASRACR